MKYNSVLYIITEQKRYFKICTTLIKLTHNKLSSGKKNSRYNYITSSKNMQPSHVNLSHFTKAANKVNRLVKMTILM